VKIKHANRLVLGINCKEKIDHGDLRERLKSGELLVLVSLCCQTPSASEHWLENQCLLVIQECSRAQTNNNWIERDWLHSNRNRFISSYIVLSMKQREYRQRLSDHNVVLGGRVIEDHSETKLSSLVQRKLHQLVCRNFCGG
jgi:hypothetical protein